MRTLVHRGRSPATCQARNPCSWQSCHGARLPYRYWSSAVAAAPTAEPRPKGRPTTHRSPRRSAPAPNAIEVNCAGAKRPRPCGRRRRCREASPCRQELPRSRVRAARRPTRVPTRKPAPTAGSPRALLSPADRGSFARLARTLSGGSGVAVSPLGLRQDVQVLGGLRSTIAWSTSKVPVAMAVIAAGRGGAQASNLRQAVSASDNAAAERLWASLGGGQRAASAAERPLRAAGDDRTRIQSQRLRGGFTRSGRRWRLSDQARSPPGSHVTTRARRSWAS